MLPLALLLPPPAAAGLPPSEAALREEVDLNGDQLVMLRAVKQVRAHEAVAAREARSGRQHDPAWLRRIEGELSVALSSDELERLAAGAADLEGVWGKSTGSPTTNLVYTSLTPCRVFDTSAAGATTGPLVAGTPMALLVAGTAGFSSQGGTLGGCGVPVGPATAVMLNLTAKNPTGKGNVRAYAWESPAPTPPLSSLVNYNQITTTNGQGMNIANGVIVPLCPFGLGCVADIYALASFAGTDLIGDVLGYFAYAGAAPQSAWGPGTGVLGATCTNILSITMSAPTAGNVLVLASVQAGADHTCCASNDVAFFLSTTSASCLEPGELAGKLTVPAVAPTGTYQQWTTGMKTFSVPAGTTSFYLNAKVTLGGLAGYNFFSQMDGLFSP